MNVEEKLDNKLIDWNFKNGIQDYLEVDKFIHNSEQTMSK